jgi:carnitine 3-dehydrogenase
MLLHVDAEAGRASPAAPELLARVARLAKTHAALPWPERAGRAVGLRA